MTRALEFRAMSVYAPDTVRAYHYTEDAICDQVGTPQDWDRIGESHPDLHAVALARRVCGRCPVLSECMDDARDGMDVYTFRAATMGSEREQMWRNQPCSRGHDASNIYSYGGTRKCRECERLGYQRRKESA